MYIVIAILMFGVLIAIHEFGHFATAKACRVRVDEFSIGMGPAIFKKQKGETQYSLRILPIGDEHIDYAKKLAEKYAAAGLRVTVDDSSNTIGYKIRATQMEKVPYMLVIGAKEMETGSVAVRNRAGETVTKTVDGFLADALVEVAEKRR